MHRLRLAPFLTLALLVPSAPAAEPPKVNEVILVFKSHFDIGYTGLAREVVDRYRTSMIDKALEVCDQTRSLPPEQRFIWTVPGWPMAQILWPGQTLERRKRIESAVRDGLLVWHALPGSLHTESLELEDVVRGLRFSSELSRQFGQPPARDAKMTDVPSHVWLLPTLLKRAGVDFLHLGCNSASASPDLPPLFWWEGPDGSRLLTMYEAGGYGSGLKPPDGWPHKTWLGMIHSGDNAGPPQPAEVAKVLEQAAKELPGVKVRMGRLSDFGDAILREKPELPVVRADMPDTWIHGIMSMPQETALARNLRPAIGTLESLGTLLACWGVDVPSPKAAVAAAYEGSLMYGEHTWGYSTPLDRRFYGEPWAKERAAGKYARMEESWREHGDNIRRADAAVTPALRACVLALGKSVKQEGPRVVVFNPLPWARDDVVELNCPQWASPGQGPAGLKDSVTGEVAPLENDKGRCRFVARGLPPLGYRTYIPAGAAPRASVPGGTLSGPVENRYFQLQVDATRGVVTSLVDKRTGRQWVDQKSKYGFGQYLYERFDEDRNQAYLKAYCKYIPGWWGHFTRINLLPAKDSPYSATSPQDFRAVVRKTDVSTAVTMTANLAHDPRSEVSLEVELLDELPCVELKWTIRNKSPDPWPEAGWLCLPLAVADPSYRLGRLGSITDPAKDARRGANFDVFCLNSGMTVTSSDGGIGLCPADSPLVSLGYPGVWRHTKEFTPREPAVLVNLFNNVWGTNFQQWIGGSWSSRVRLWSAESRNPENGLIPSAWETRCRSLGVLVDGKAGTLPAVQSGLELSRPGVLVTAFGPNPDGDGTLLRLWEQSGQDGRCRVRLPSGLPFTAARPCDLRGRPQGDPLPIRDGWLEVPLGRYAPASVILGRSSPVASTRRLQ